MAANETQGAAAMQTITPGTSVYLGQPTIGRSREAFVVAEVDEEAGTVTLDDDKETTLRLSQVRACRPYGDGPAFAAAGDVVEHLYDGPIPGEHEDTATSRGTITHVSADGSQVAIRWPWGGHSVDVPLYALRMVD